MREDKFEKKKIYSNILHLFPIILVLSLKQKSRRKKSSADKGQYNYRCFFFNYTKNKMW